MCTVSFVNANGKIIITSNRDEKIIRPKAIEPKSYCINNKNILFPKDPKAGGTWFAVDEYSNIIVLLNGADEKHIVTGNYKKSRGLIVLETSIGLVAILPIGMCQVSSVVITAEVGMTVRKGEELSYFQFGGSDIIVLFEAASNVCFSAQKTIHYKMGVKIAQAYPVI